MRIPQLGQWEPVVVTWNDANGGEEGWTKLRKAHREIAGCVTVGQVESQSADRLTLVFTIDHTSRECRGTLTIPTSAITKVTRLS